MHSLFHVLNIGTLATWLSVAGFGTVGVIVPQWHPSVVIPLETDATVMDQDFILGDDAPPSSGGESVEIAPAGQVEPLPAPPELQPMAELAPLPEIPAMPARAAATKEAPAVRESAPRQSSLTGTTGRPRAASAPSGRAAASGGRSSSGVSSADRLAAGRMPAPSYPAEARRKGQTGTVVVEFIVDSAGRVISAHAKSPSPWPLLNNEAVRTVRRWKFPPGGIMKLQRPIVFQLR